MNFIKMLPGGQHLMGFASDPEIGENVEPEDADKFFP